MNVLALSIFSGENLDGYMIVEDPKLKKESSKMNYFKFNEKYFVLWFYFYFVMYYLSYVVSDIFIVFE